VRRAVLGGGSGRLEDGAGSVSGSNGSGRGGLEQGIGMQKGSAVPVARLRMCAEKQGQRGLAICRMFIKKGEGDCVRPGRKKPTCFKGDGGHSWDGT